MHVRYFNILWGPLKLMVPIIDLYLAYALWRRNYNDNGWTQLPGRAIWVSAGIDYSVWCCNIVHNIYRWNPTKNDWDRMDGACAQVCDFFVCTLTYLDLNLFLVAFHFLDRCMDL